MCASCACTLRKAHKIEWLVRSLAVMPLTFPELFIVRLINHDWNHAVNTLLGLYRGLQYKLPCKEYSSIQTSFLKTHYAEFGRHVPWQVHTFCALSQCGQLTSINAHMDMRHELSCRQCLCSRTCDSRMSIPNILQLGMAGCLRHIPLSLAVIQAWNIIHPNIHVKMMFWWVYLGCTYPILFEKGLIPMCRKRLSLLYSLWFECELQKEMMTRPLLTKVQQKLVDQLQPSACQDLQVSIQFVELLSTLVRTKGRRVHDHYIQRFFSQFGGVRLPWKPSCIVVNVRSIKRFASSSKPLSVRCSLKNGNDVQLLIKQEDVRTDRLAMVIGYWIETLTKQQVCLYDVFPITTDLGCIVMIPDACTLYDIRKTTSLLNFVMTHNADKTVSFIRERIVSSCVGACLLAFTMGLGDRHLENILLTKHGTLAHVDFGYVLGEDPKHVSTPMRITEDMVDAMGGKGSVTFVKFIDHTQKGYETIRLYASFWFHLLSTENYIHKRRDRNIERIARHVLNRFVPGEWSDEASLHIQTVVQRAAEGSIVQQASDMMHQASNHVARFFQLDL